MSGGSTDQTAGDDTGGAQHAQVIDGSTDQTAGDDTGGAQHTHAGEWWLNRSDSWR